MAYGDWKQIVKPDGIVVDDLRFQFKDGSLYEEMTKFRQRSKFRLVSDQVTQKGPSFKEQRDSWIDAETGTITVRTNEKGKEKTTTHHVDVPDDVSIGLLFVLLKNVDPSAEATVSFVSASSKPRLVKVGYLFRSRKNHQSWPDDTEGTTLYCENQNSRSGRRDCSAHRQTAS